jgi:2-hydroxyglutarate dehydrogenase
MLPMSRWVSPVATSLSFHSKAFYTTKRPELQVDNIVIGAGVVGLAIGEKLTRERPHESTFVIEKNKRVGEETRYKKNATYLYAIMRLNTLQRS